MESYVCLSAAVGSGRRDGKYCAAVDRVGDGGSRGTGSYLSAAPYRL